MALPIKVGIVDDHPGVRVGIRNMLSGAEDITVVAEGENGLEAIHIAERLKPDILLLDVEIPILRGDEVMKRLRETNPEVRVLAVSSYDDPMYIHGMLENGAAGYITKGEVPELLITALHSIMQDHVKWISPNSAKKISKITLEYTDFTGSELDILRLLSLGKQDQEIMRILKIDSATLSHRFDQLDNKLAVSSREQLVDEARSILSTVNI